ncbi:MAG TPA: radical SAM protein, partial [bacterium]|nr:radical SAM protein [bacterium]
MLFIQPDEAVHAIGSRYISAVLKAAGHEAVILFSPRRIDDFESERDLQAIASFADRFSPDVIGFGFMTGHFRRVKRITECLRSALHVPIIYGGVHATCAPEHALQFADAVCVGEGESVILNLATAFDEGRGFQGVPGIWYHSGHRIIRQTPPVRNPDLDQLPFPDYSNHYVLQHGKISFLSPDRMRMFKYHCNGVHFIMTSRGCPGTCAFCCNQAMKHAAPGLWIRRRSVSNILDECRAALAEFPHIEGFAFWDDSLLTSSSDWLDTFCQRYPLEIGLPFLCNLSPDEVTEDRIRCLTRAGLSGIQMGLQTGSDRMNRCIFNRRSRAETFIHADLVLNRFKDKLP